MHRINLLTHRICWKAGLALLLALLGDYLFYAQHLSGGYIGVFAFGLVICAVAGRNLVRRDGRAWFALAAASVFVIALIVDPGLLSWVMFWVALSMAALIISTAQFDDGWLWFQRLLMHAFRSPIAPLLDAVKLRHALSRPTQRRFSIRRVLPVLALPLVGSAIILSLFATANPVIGNVLAAIRLPELNAGRIALWLMLFTLAWSVLRPRLPQHLIPTFDGSGDLPLPGVSVSSVLLSLVLFNLLFAVQNLLDGAYLWGILPIPADMTRAEYVHRGAYPLIATAVLAAIFVLVTLRPGSSTAAAPTIRKLVIVWIGQNMILVASSVLRTLDYIETSLLTTLRIEALAWMALVALGLVLICWRMLFGKSASWLINTNLAAAAGLLTLACFVDTGAIAAQWNVRHAREIGTHSRRLDLCYLSSLGSSSLLPLIELERRPLRPAFRERVQAVREAILNNLTYSNDHGGWTWRGADRLEKAKALLADVPALQLRPGFRSCDGKLLRAEEENADGPTQPAALTGSEQQ